MNRQDLKSKVQRMMMSTSNSPVTQVAVKKKKSLQFAEVSPIRHHAGSPSIGFQRKERHREERSRYFDSKENRNQKTSRNKYGKPRNNRLKKVSKKERLARARKERNWDRHVWGDNFENMTEPKLKTQREKQYDYSSSWKTNSQTHGRRNYKRESSNAVYRDYKKPRTLQSKEPIVVDLVSSSDEETEKKKKKKKVMSSPSSKKNPIILDYTCCDGHSVMLKAKDVARLTDGRMLNDSLIDFYLKYLSDKFRDIIPTVTSRVFIFSTYFYTKLTEGGFNYENVTRWTRKKNLFREFSLVFIPINKSGHWSLALVWNMRGFYSLLHLDALRMHDHNEIARNIGRYLRKEWFRLKKDGQFENLSELPRSLEKLKVSSVSVPRQRNGYDCGMFVCAYSEKIFQEFQEAFHSDLKEDDEQHFSGNMIRQDRSEYSIFIVVKSLKEREKRGWFTSQHVTNMRSILKNKIRAMAKAQRESNEMMTTTTTMTTKKRQKRIESSDSDEDVSDKSKRFSVQDNDFVSKKKKKKNITLVDDDDDDSSETEDEPKVVSPRKQVSVQKKSANEIDKSLTDELSSVSKRRDSSVDCDLTKDESPRESKDDLSIVSKKRNSSVDFDFTKDESPRESKVESPRISSDFKKDEKPAQERSMNNDEEDVVVIGDSDSETNEELPLQRRTEPKIDSLQEKFAKKVDSLQTTFSNSKPASPKDDSLEEFWNDVLMQT
eukprot:g4312.t1